MPCVIRLLPVPKPSAGFFDFDEYARLIDAAMALDRSTHLIVLLGGDAGLRCGEILALEWRDVDLHKRQLCVLRSEWKGHRHGAERRTAALCATHDSTRNGASRTTASAIGSPS